MRRLPGLSQQGQESDAGVSGLFARLRPRGPYNATHDIIGRSGRFSYLVGRLCGKLPGIFYVRHLIVAVSAGQLPAMPRGYSARPLTAADLAPHRIDADAATQEERFSQGMTCLGLFDRHDALLGVTWLGQGAHEETMLRVHFHLPAGAAWDGGLWIDEERRMSRAFTALWAGIGLWLEAEGLHQTISSIADYNAASLAAHRRLGAQIIGQIGVVRIGRMQWTWVSRPVARLTCAKWPVIMLPSA